MLTRGKLAAQTGCHIETIRYYERTGVLPEPERTASGYRIYNKDHVRRLQFIQKAKSLGFSSKRMHELLEISYSAEFNTRSEVKALTETHILEISQKIEDLQKIRGRLLEISSHCDGSEESSDECPIMISLFNS